ncbi:hypothetical protein [Pedobacter agri]|uniref:Uncharacterized protein n=1 Tax=Pedobacter agri TaxID=454586 RepID=A0A9X3DI39_9SPHI|nr:hypothetical protein [Pedobacter agri]MCX3266571.1 hypothetical protein [Pedobacter agri]
MKIRELKTIARPNGEVHREYNHLRILNIDYFLESTSNTYEPYLSPFAILADLESQVMFENDPPESLLIGYKEDGDCIFELVSVDLIEHNRRTVTYEFMTTIS